MKPVDSPRDSIHSLNQNIDDFQSNEKTPPFPIIQVKNVEMSLLTSELTQYNIEILQKLFSKSHRPKIPWLPVRDFFKMHLSTEELHDRFHFSMAMSLEHILNKLTLSEVNTLITRLEKTIIHSKNSHKIQFACHVSHILEVSWGVSNLRTAWGSVEQHREIGNSTEKKLFHSARKEHYKILKCTTRLRILNNRYIPQLNRYVTGRKTQTEEYYLDPIYNMGSVITPSEETNNMNKNTQIKFPTSQNRRLSKNKNTHNEFIESQNEGINNHSFINDNEAPPPSSPSIPAYVSPAILPENSIACALINTLKESNRHVRSQSLTFPDRIKKQDETSD